VVNDFMMAQRFELQRAFSMPVPQGVERIVTSWFVPPSTPSTPVRGVVVVTLSSWIERGTAGRTAPV
jgi:hypothetical protein